MATTTNYSWTTPDDTALVKDGAAAIRSLGTAIDTTVFNNASAGIAKTIVDAKGDLIVGTAADTVARLASSATNGDLLTVDTSTASGLKWAAPSSSSGLVHIATTAFSNVATQDFSAIFSATYKSYLVVINEIYAATAGDDLHLQFRYGSSVLTSTTFSVSWEMVSNGGNSQLTQNSGSHVLISTHTGGSTDPGGGYFYVQRAAQANGNILINGQFTTTAFLGNSFQGLGYAAQTFNGFRLKSSSSNITGNVSIYGLANS